MFGKRPLLPRTTKAKPKAKADVVGIVYVPHVDYGVVGVPCSAITRSRALSVQRTSFTKHVRTLILTPQGYSKERRPDAYLTREEAAATLKSILQEDLKTAKREFEEARKEVAKLEERVTRVEQEGVRFYEDHNDLAYLEAPGPSAKTVEQKAKP